MLQGIKTSNTSASSPICHQVRVFRIFIHNRNGTPQKIPHYIKRPTPQ